MVTLEQAKRQLRIKPQDTIEDDYITSLIPVAYDYIQDRLGRTIHVGTRMLVKSVHENEINIKSGSYILLDDVVTNNLTYFNACDGSGAIIMTMTRADYYLTEAENNRYTRMIFKRDIDILTPDGSYPIILKAEMNVGFITIPKPVETAVLMTISQLYQSSDGLLMANVSKFQVNIDSLIRTYKIV